MWLSVFAECSLGSSTTQVFKSMGLRINGVPQQVMFSLLKGSFLGGGGVDRVPHFGAHPYDYQFEIRFDMLAFPKELLFGSLSSRHIPTHFLFSSLRLELAETSR